MFSKRLGIDLGTANSVVYLVGSGIVLNEPTVVAISAEDNRVLAVGNEAKEMLGRTPGNIIASRPMKDGVIADYMVTEAMLRYFIEKVCGRSYLFKPEVMICTPAIKNLIRESKTAQIYSAIQTSQKYGMQTLEASVKSLLERKLVAPEEVQNILADLTRPTP